MKHVRKTGSAESVTHFPEKSDVWALRRSCFATLLLGRNLRSSVMDSEPPACFGRYGPCEALIIRAKKLKQKNF